MRRLEFSKDLSRIVSGLKAEELLALVREVVDVPKDVPINDAQKNEFSKLIFESQNAYNEFLREPGTSRILTELDLGRLYSPEILANLITWYRSSPNTASIARNPMFYGLFSSFHALLTWFIDFARASSSLLAEHPHHEAEDEATVSLTILDFDESGIDLLRLRMFFTAINDLGTQISKLFKVDDETLKVYYIESGSKIVLDIKGAAKIIDSLRQFFLDLHRLLAYGKFERVDRRSASISGQIDLLGKIQQAEEAGTISTQDGKNIRRAVFKDLELLMGTESGLTGFVPDEFFRDVPVLFGHQLEPPAKIQRALPSPDSKTD
jgi:hypothetical protein